ncbi:MAG: hypothetical protein IKU51_03540 [Clostridia bacterium]|nr:hypothetical protein [Clostridia bacterium]
MKWVMIVSAVMSVAIHIMAAIRFWRVIDKSFSRPFYVRYIKKGSLSGLPLAAVALVLIYRGLRHGIESDFLNCVLLAASGAFISLLFVLILWRVYCRKKNYNFTYSTHLEWRNCALLYVAAIVPTVLVLVWAFCFLGYKL